MRSPTTTSPVAIPTRTCRDAGSGLQHRHRLNQRKSGTHGTLGVVLVGLRIAEISQHPIADVPGDEAPKTTHGH